MLGVLSMAMTVCRGITARGSQLAAKGQKGMDTQHSIPVPAAPSQGLGNMPQNTVCIEEDLQGQLRSGSASAFTEKGLTVPRTYTE